MTNAELSDGFCWVRRFKQDKDWTVGEWDGESWWLIGREEPFVSLAEIGPRIERPSDD